MKLMQFILGLFSKHKTGPSLFSQALSEGIREMFIEMGYRLNGKGEK